MEIAKFIFQILGTVGTFCAVGVALYVSHRAQAAAHRDAFRRLASELFTTAFDLYETCESRRIATPEGEKKKYIPRINALVKKLRSYGYTLDSADMAQLDYRQAASECMTLLSDKVRKGE